MIIKIHNHCQFEPSNSLSFQEFCKWCGKEQSEHSTTMSNNKQSMKLYTEEHMSVAINAAKANPEQSYLILALLKPIEVPSNEEIEEQASRYSNCQPYAIQPQEYKAGARWMRDKLTNIKGK